MARGPLPADPWPPTADRRQSPTASGRLFLFLRVLLPLEPWGSKSIDLDYNFLTKSSIRRRWPKFENIVSASKKSAEASKSTLGALRFKIDVFRLQFLSEIVNSERASKICKSGFGILRKYISLSLCIYIYIYIYIKRKLVEASKSALGILRFRIERFKLQLLIEIVNSEREAKLLEKCIPWAGWHPTRTQGHNNQCN